MYLLDDRFSTAVSFVQGFNAALDGEPLAGFQEWVSIRILGRKSSLHWAYVIASTRAPEVLEGRVRVDELPSELDGPLTDALMEVLEKFLEVSNPLRE
ncbi:hypothetical protein GXW82_21285 [Streptacidiphilus sp. 4-A2]|nr:hypothetical protein [Streptacidiphilus sp. 4-A2]